MKSYILVSISLLLCSCQAKLPVNVPELSDGNPTTCFVGTEGVNKVILMNNILFPSKVIKSIRPARRLFTIRLPGH